jgi:hypothetical protein
MTRYLLDYEKTFHEPAVQREIKKGMGMKECEEEKCVKCDDLLPTRDRKTAREPCGQLWLKRVYERTGQTMSIALARRSSRTEYMFDFCYAEPMLRGV